MKNKIFGLIVIISINLAFMAPCWSYIESVAVWSKGDKKIAIFGDIHEGTELDARHKELFLPFFEQLAEGNRKAEVILEHGSEGYVKKVQNPKCINYLSLYAYEQKLHKGNLTFTLSDIRQIFPGLDLITDFVFLFRDLSSNDDKLINAIGYPNFDRNLLEKWAQKKPLLHSEVLEEIGITLNIIKTYKETVTDKEVREFFEQTTQKIEALEHNLKDFFEVYNQKATIIRRVDPFRCATFEFNAGTVLASFLQAAQEGSFSKDTLDDLRKQYINPLFYDLAEAVFVKDVIESQKNSDVTLAYTGSSHAMVINRLLLALGYTLDESVSKGPFFEGAGVGHLIDVKAAERAINALFKELK